MEAYRLEELDITAACQLNKKTIISVATVRITGRSSSSLGLFSPSAFSCNQHNLFHTKVSLSETIALGNNGPEEAVDGKREEREKTGMINGR